MGGKKLTVIWSPAVHPLGDITCTQYVPGSVTTKIESAEPSCHWYDAKPPPACKISESAPQTTVSLPRLSSGIGRTTMVTESSIKPSHISVT